MDVWSPRSSEVPLRYGLLLFPQWELLDAAGPVEALNCLAHSADFPYVSDLDFCVIAETLDPVPTGALANDPKPFNRKITQSIVPTHTFDNPPELDVLIIPGGFGTGPGALHAGKDGWEPNVDAVVDFIAKMYAKLEYVISTSKPLPYLIPCHYFVDMLIFVIDGSCLLRLRPHCSCWHSGWPPCNN